MDNSIEISKWVGSKVTTQELWSGERRLVGVYSVQPYLEDRGSKEMYYYVFIDIEGHLSMITSGSSVNHMQCICKNIALFGNCGKVI